VEITFEDEFDLDVRLASLESHLDGCINDPPHTTTCQVPTCQESTCWDNCAQPPGPSAGCPSPQVISNQCHFG
jgi:hypothetical protein